MQNKMPKIKALQDVRIGNYLPNSSALPKLPEFVLVNIRPNLVPMEAPKPRLVIPIMVKKHAADSQPQPVKITRR